jgi:hypothetical protein
MTNRIERKEILGRYISEMRKNVGLNMVETSLKLSQLEGASFTRSQWNNWELGIREPSHHCYESLAKVLGTTRELLAWDFLKETCNTSINQITKLKEREIKRDDVMHHIVIDNTLEPHLQKGDEVLINTANKSVFNVGLFALQGNGGLWLRWVRPELTGGYTAYCADKNQYPDQSVATLAELCVVGQVVNISRWL